MISHILIYPDEELCVLTNIGILIMSDFWGGVCSRKLQNRNEPWHENFQSYEANAGILYDIIFEGN